MVGGVTPSTKILGQPASTQQFSNQH